MKQRLWIIALKGGEGAWGDNWAFNRINSKASTAGDIFLTPDEVGAWLDEYEEFWTMDDRELCVYWEDFEL